MTLKSLETRGQSWLRDGNLTWFRQPQWGSWKLQISDRKQKEAKETLSSFTVMWVRQTKSHLPCPHSTAPSWPVSTQAQSRKLPVPPHPQPQAALKASFSRLPLIVNFQQFHLDKLCWEETEQACWGSSKRRIMTVPLPSFHHEFVELPQCAGCCIAVAAVSSSGQTGAWAHWPSFWFPCFHPFHSWD